MQAYNAVLCGPSSKARWQEGQSVTMFCSMPLPPCERRITCATGSPLFPSAEDAATSVALVYGLLDAFGDGGFLLSAYAFFAPPHSRSS